MGRGPAAVIVDGSGNELTIVDDSGTYRLALPLGAATETTLATLATETKLEAVRVLLASLDGKDFATETTLATLATEAKLEAVRVLLVSIDGKDFATETTLATLATEAKLETVRVLLASLDGKDFATETTLATLATESKLEAVRVLLASLDGKDFATETTLATLATEAKLEAVRVLLASLDGKDFSTETTLASIKDTDGIKKITDQLPSGTNEIGGVAQGTKAALADAWPTVPTDSSGNAIGSLSDNSIRRLETRSTVSGQIAGSGSETKVTVIQDVEDSNEHRLQTEARLAPGSTVNLGTSIPSDPSNLVIDFFEDGGSSHDFLVDGSGTSVVFTFGPSGSEVWSLQEALVVFTSDDFEFDGASFGPNTLLTNGILIELVQDASVVELFNIRQNEDFLRTPGRLPLVNNTGPKDVLSSTLSFGGLIKLDAATSDVIRATVRDDLTSVKLKYLTVTGYATKDA